MLTILQTACRLAFALVNRASPVAIAANQNEEWDEAFFAMAVPDFHEAEPDGPGRDPAFDGTSGRWAVFPPVKLVRGRLITGAMYATREVFHTGIDMPCQEGEPVFATEDARVVAKSRGERDHHSYFANYVWLAGDSSLNQVFIHVASSVEVGDRVLAGFPVGRVDLSGMTLSPHLHFSLLMHPYFNSLINPLFYLDAFITT